MKHSNSTKRRDKQEASSAPAAHCRQARALCLSLALLVTPLCFLTSGLSSAAAQQENPVTVEHVFEQWHRRQAAAERVRFTWSADRSGLNRWSTYQAAQVPKADAALEQPENLLTLDRGRLRYVTNRWYQQAHLEFSDFTHSHLTAVTPATYSFALAKQTMFADPSQQFKNPARFTSVFDGQTRTDLLAASANRAPVANIVSTTRYMASLENVDDLIFRPIVIAYRPLAPDLMNAQPTFCRVVQQDSFVNGRQCALIEERAELLGPEVVRLYWVDPSRECVVVRCIVNEGGQSREQLDIDYTHDSAHGWVPTRWTVIVFPNGRKKSRRDFPGRLTLYQHAGAVVESYAFNESVEQPEPEPTFPAGTVVFDRKAKQQYVLEKDGNKRVLSTGELTDLIISYSELTSSNNERWPWDALAKGATGVAAAAIAFLYLRRRRSRATARIRPNES